MPSIIEGDSSFGQYMRSMRMNCSLGAGSQLDSFSLPGNSFWMYRSTEPLALGFRWLRSPML